MRGQWVSQTRKLNRHYQSTPTQVPQEDFIVYTHNMRYSNEYQVQGQTVHAFNLDGFPMFGGYFNYSGITAGLYAFNILQADAGSEHSFTYKATDNDFLDLDLKYGLAPDYISPYLGGSAVLSQGVPTVSALGGKPRNIVNSVKVTLEIDTTFTIDLLKLETDEYAAAGATYSKTYRTGSNADLYFLQGLDVVFIDANDSTNYLLNAQNMYITSSNKVERTTVLNNASNWTQNTVPTQYKVNLGYWVNRNINIELQGYIEDEFIHCGVTQATGSTTIKLSLKEV